MEQDQPFAKINLKQELLVNLESLAYDAMTPIQAKSLPIMLNGQDVIAKAETGSGKTAAFGLSLLNRLNVEKYAVQALVLCPTRELAEQVSQELRKLARQLPNVKVLSLSGGMPMRPQLDSLRHGAHIIVGTPGRVQKHLDKATLSLKNLENLVLDEADRMLDMGFFDAIHDVIKFCPRKRQTLLFSATFPAEIKKLSSQFMQKPKRIEVEEKQVKLDIEQVFYEVNSPNNKFGLLKTLLLHHKYSSTLIFCNTKDQSDKLVNTLKNEGFSAIGLNGDMEQADRNAAMIRFKNQSAAILVATDVAARGLDIKELPLVISYDLAFEHDVHIHRIGRTGRAGNKGLAITLTTPNDAGRLCVIEERLKNKINFANAKSLNKTETNVLSPDMVTLCLNVGKREKIRPGDILGALTKDAGLSGDNIGKIDIASVNSYVAVHKTQLDKALQYFQNGKIKSRKVLARKLQ